MKVPKLEIDKLETERIILIPFTTEICKNILDENFDYLLKLGLKRGKSWPDADVIETLPKIITNLSFVNNIPTGFESWMIIKKQTSEIIGDLGFKGFNYEKGNIDIGYGIIKEERGNGFAEEATKTLIKWVFTKNIVKEITARCLVDNNISIKLLKKLNFEKIKNDNELIYWSLKPNIDL